MDIRHLEYFAEVAKHLNFTKAAAALHVSQPSLSKTIKNLEERLGVPLFYRSSKQLELTDAGKVVLVNAKHVLDAFKNLSTELTDMMTLKKGEIRIGIPPIIGAAFFSKLISHFKEKYPLIDIIFTEVGTKKIMQEVYDGALDIGLICNYPVQKSSFEVIKLLKDPLMVVVDKTNPLADKSSLDFSDLKKESFILYRKDFSLYDRIMEECAKNNFYPHIVCESSQKEFMIEMVEAKLGIALLPSRICANLDLETIRSIPFQRPAVNLELGMIWKKNKYLPFAVRELITMTETFTI